MVDKPKGWTSFDVVNYVRKIVAVSQGKKPRNVKVGHTGTLDPMATGLLVLVIGRSYTKKVPELIKHNKTYEAEITFGFSSSTGDADGEITELENAKKIAKPDVEEALVRFEGEQLQTPPNYSAVKVNGKRAYQLARAGKEVDIKPRSIVVHELKLSDYSWPKVKLLAKVGSGTYIRTLAEDIAASMDSAAYLSALRRTEVDRWSIGQAQKVDSLTVESIRDNLLA